MKWSFVDSCGLDIVLKPQANGRVFHAHEKLQQGSYGLTKASIRQPCHRTLGACRQFDPLTILFFRTREYICRSSAAVFVISKEQ